MRTATRVTVLRLDPESGIGPTVNTYEVALPEPITVLGLLNDIFARVDPTLAYRRCRCYRGVCGACLMSINGRNQRACSVLVHPGDELTIGPALGYTVIRDLVVDLEPYMAGSEDAREP